MRWLDCITDSMDMNLSKLQEGQGNLACCSPWGHRVGHNWVTEQQNGIKDLSSLTKNGPVLPAVECTVLTTGQAGKSQDISLCEVPAEDIFFAFKINVIRI